MDTFKFYIVSLTDTDPDVVNGASMRIKTYFSRIIQKIDSAGQKRGQDLLNISWVSVASAV